MGHVFFYRFFFVLLVWVMLFELNLKHYGRTFKNSINNYLLTALEKENGDLAKVEVNEMTGFVSDVRSKVPSNNTMPSWIVFLIEFFFDIRCNI